MVRRALCLLLIIVFACTASAYAEWRVDFESKSVKPNETGVTVDLTAYWDLSMYAFLVPVIVRSIDPGSFWTGLLPIDSYGDTRGVTWNWSGSWPDMLQLVQPLVPEPPYNDEGDIGYDGISPDHFGVLALGMMKSTPPEPTGRAILTISFDVTGEPGQFEFDAACIAPGWDVLCMIDDEFPNTDHGPRGTGEVTFNKGVITIEPEDPVVCMDTTSVLPGRNATIRLSITNPPEMGGFDFLIAYDPTMAFLDAVPIGVLADWEYFTYRKSYQDNCGGGCPTGVLRLIGLADMPDGVTPDEAVYHPEGPIIELTFATPESFNYIGQCFPISWTWYDCGDNTISSRTGDTLFMASEIADILPGEDCLAGDKGYAPIPLIDFCNGLICIIPPEDDRGDLNLNGIPNEIADAVLFSNYFIYGPGVWDPVFFENQILATDINDDGIPQTIADLVYLIRIITGDAIAYGESGEGGKTAPFADAVDIGWEIGEDMVVSLHSPVSIGGAAFIFRHTGEIGTPILTDETAGMTLRSSDVNGELRVLVFSMEHHTIPAGTHDLFTLPLDDQTIELIEIQFSDADGNLLAANMDKIAPPQAFELLQNYPNPFNAGTVISFALPVASDWSMSIYNIAGQMVKEFKGHNEAGMVNLHWDAANVASGIYFYKLVAGDFTDNKKMTLMK